MCIAIQDGIQLLGIDLCRPGSALTLQLNLHTTAHHGDTFRVPKGGCARGPPGTVSPFSDARSETATRMPLHAKRWCSDAANKPYSNLRHWGCADKGILRTTRFGDLRWDESAYPAAVSDVLRVHEWSYVLAIKQVLCLAAACVWDRGAKGASCTLKRMCAVHHRAAGWGSSCLTYTMHLAQCKVSSPSWWDLEHWGGVHAKALKPA